MLLSSLGVSIVGAQGPGASAVGLALNRLYNFDFTGANRILDQRLHEASDEPLVSAFRASSLLFQELDRLQILEGEFFSDDKRIIEKRKLTPDAQLRKDFFNYLVVTRNKARTRLRSEPKHPDSLFALSLAAGLETDYAALIEKKQLGSLSHAKESYRYATELLKLDPSYADAHMTTGITEYLLGSIPFFVRWIFKFDQAQGDKTRAVANLEKVVRNGRYLGPFAKILLAIIHLREKRPQETERLLTELVREFPENPLMRKELAKVAALRKSTVP